MIKKLKDEYIRDAIVVSVTDGDTIVLCVDLGCDLSITMKCRLDGINCPEKNVKAGQDAKTFLTTLLATTPNVIVKTVKDKKEKFGRYLAILYLPNNPTSVNQQIVDAGHAVEYHGEKRT